MGDRFLVLYNIYKADVLLSTKETTNRHFLTKEEESYGEMPKKRSANLLIFLDKTPIA